MKRFILSAFAVLFTAVSLVGCGHTQSQAESKTEIRATAVSEQMSPEQKTEFTIEDARDLQNFLLAKPTD